METEKVSQNRKWICCPISAANKTRIQIMPDTVVKKLPLFSPKCKAETVINVEGGQLSIIKRPDA